MNQTESQQSSALEQVQDKAQETKSQVGGQVREQVDTRSTQAGEQVSSVADALRRTSDQLREDGKEQPAKLLEQGAARAEQLGGYLQRIDSDTLVRDVESFGRRRPWAMAAGAAVVGFAASRFLRASSERRYQRSPDGGSAYGGDSFGGEPYRRVPSPDVATRPGASEPWRGPDSDLGDQVRRSTTGQAS
jgi:ElaB/YqjD/DUF883 family membrane-anchored ribosome-binding protein